MKILIAPDKFKDALSAKAVCKAIEKGLKQANPNFETILFPMADGGEGTAEVLTFNTQGRMVELEVHDPLFRKTKAAYGLSKDGSTAFIEMAQASGLKLLKPEERNCLKTSTFGTGEIIKDAIAKGAKKIVLGLGGSATNDAGIGMAAALGYKFLDSTGKVLRPIGENLQKIATISVEENIFSLKGITVVVANDVKNPLFGADGAAYVYAPQKGADEAAVENLDQGLRHFAQIVEDQFHISLQSIKGAGAAGGLGAGAVTFLRGELKPGIKLIMELTQFQKALQNTDLVITGEGKIDNQTLSGKLIKGIVDEAKQAQVPVIAFCGTLEADAESIGQLGLTFATSILQKPCNLEAALSDSYHNLCHTAFNVGRMIDRFV